MSFITMLQWVMNSNSVNYKNVKGYVVFKVRGVILITMLIYIVFLLAGLGAYYAFVWISSFNNSLVPKVPKNMNLIKLGICFKELFTWLFFVGDYTNEVGGVSKCLFGPVVAYVVSSPEDGTTVLNKCNKKSFVYDLIKPYVGDQLIASEFTVWKRNRRLLDLAFKQNVLNGYLRIFNEQGNRLAQAMSEKLNCDVDFKHLISRHMLQTACYTTLGIEVNDNDLVIEKYLKSVDKLINIMLYRFTQPWLLLEFIFKFSKLKLEQDDAVKTVKEVSEKVIREKKAELLKYHDKNENDSDEEDKFQSLLDVVIKNRDDNVLTDVNVREICDNIVLAAFDSDVYMLLYILVCIGSYPEVQKRVYEEIINVIGSEERDITKEDLPKLVYLEAVIKEVVRLYPAGMIVGRATTSDLQLTDYIIPSGCQVIVHIGAMNRNKNHWGQDADEFRPERWFDSVPEHHGAFATFSPGRRSCIGKTYALMLLKIHTAKIVKKFYISGNDKRLEFEFALFLKPTAGHEIKLELR